MTFSIAARCPKSGMFGLAVASSSPAVAARCSHVRAGAGAIGSQNITDDLYNRGVLKHFKRWKDASARVQGPVAQALQVVFLRDWQLIALSVLGAVVVNQTLATNHRAGRYMAM